MTTLLHLHSNAGGARPPPPPLGNRPPRRPPPTPLPEAPPPQPPPPQVGPPAHIYLGGRVDGHTKTEGLPPLGPTHYLAEPSYRFPAPLLRTPQPD